MSDVNVTRNDEKHQYEVQVDGKPAGLTTYRDQGQVVVMPHTEVDPSYGGQGVGSALVRYALDDIRAQGKQVDPACPFVAAWIDKHPDYADLVAR